MRGCEGLEVPAGTPEAGRMLEWLFPSPFVAGGTEARSVGGGGRSAAALFLFLLVYEGP